MGLERIGAAKIGNPLPVIVADMNGGVAVLLNGVTSPGLFDPNSFAAAAGKEIGL